MSDYRIDTGIPVPGHPRKNLACKYPFVDLKVGESFFVPLKDAARANIGAIASNVGRKTGRKFTTRMVTEDGVKGTRVWCLVAPASEPDTTIEEPEQQTG